MAFSSEEQQIIEFGKQNGKTRQEVEQAVLRFRAGITTPRTPESQERIGQFAQEAQRAEEEAERIASPFGQFKEFGKELGEFSGITPTARKIAAGIAPSVVPEAQLPGVVEELAGGVTTPQPSKLKEFAQTALDLPIISIGLSKSIASFLGKQGTKIAPEGLKNVLSKGLTDFLPNVFKKDVSTPAVEKLGEVGEKVIDIAKKPFSFAVSRVPKLLGIITGESTDAVTAALKNPVAADKAIAAGDEALRTVLKDAGTKSIELRTGFLKGHRAALDQFSQSLPSGLTFDKKEIVSQFAKLLESKNVKIVDGELDFTTSLIQANVGEVAKVKQAWKALNTWEDFSFNGTNDLKRLLQQLTRFSDDAGVPAKSPTLGVAQRELNDLIKRTLAPEQKEVLEEINKNFANNIELFDDMVDAFNKGDPFTRLAGVFGDKKDSLRQIVEFFEKQGGDGILSTVAGRELAAERKAAFGFLNPRTWIDLIFPPEFQAKLVTRTGKTFPSLTK